MKRAGIIAGRYRLHQRARHLDAARRRDRTRRGAAAGRQRRRQDLDVVDQVVDRPSAGRRRRGRGDLLRSWRSATASRRRRSISTIRRSKPRSIWCRTRPRKREINVALSNSFGFGGTNASLVFRRTVVERRRLAARFAVFQVMTLLSRSILRSVDSAALRPARSMRDGSRGAVRSLRRLDRANDAQTASVQIDIART